MAGRPRRRLALATLDSIEDSRAKSAAFDVKLHSLLNDDERITLSEAQVMMSVESRVEASRANTRQFIDEFNAIWRSGVTSQREANEQRERSEAALAAARERNDRELEQRWERDWREGR
jgi:hypothetical protein